MHMQDKSRQQFRWRLIDKQIYLTFNLDQGQGHI